MDINDKADGSTGLFTPTGTIRVPCHRDEVSDGYHTFKELDDHLDALFARLCSVHRELSWKQGDVVHPACSKGYALAVLMLSDRTDYEPQAMCPMARCLPVPLWQGILAREVREPVSSWSSNLEANLEYLLGQPMPVIKDTTTTGTIHTPTETIGVPYSVGQVSDGEYSFNDLYALRHALFIALCHTHHDLAWKSLVHEDGSMFDRYFIAGIQLPEGMVTYHLPIELWEILQVEELGAAPTWDGHTAQDVVDRLLQGL